MLIESEEGVFGFQTTTRGLGLYTYAPDFGLKLDGVVTLEGGSLAQYRVVDKSDGDLYFTLWQGPHHDLFTTDHSSLAEAVQILSGFKITDEPGGVTLAPRAGRFGGHKIVEVSVTMEFGDFVIRLEKADPSGSHGPDWPGRKGEGGDFYSLDEGKPGILFVSNTAIAKLETWRSEDHRSSLEAHLDDFLAHLSMNWHTTG